MNFTEILEWFKDNFSLDELENNLLYSDFQLENEANYYCLQYKVPIYGDGWRGIFIEFDNIFFFFENNKEIIGYNKNNTFTKTNITEKNLCDLYDMQYIPVEEKISTPELKIEYGVLKYIPNGTYIGNDSPVSNSLVQNIYHARIFSNIELKDSPDIFTEDLGEYGEVIDYIDLEWVKIKIEIQK